MRIDIVNLILILAILLTSNDIALGKDSSASNLLLASAAQAQSEPSDTIEQIEHLTKQVILKEIELEKFNLHYRKEVGKQGRWSGWRYATLQEANFCLNLASGIYSTSERSSHFKDPDKLSPAKLERSNITSMVGYIIGASAGALELGITEFHDIQASRKGFSPKAAKAHVLSLKIEIDKLLIEREALLKIESAAPLLHYHAAEDLAEGKVLVDLRDLALLEYEKFHIGARRYVAFQKSLYFLDMTKYTCSAIGSFFAFLSQHRHDRKWNLRAGILDDIAGGLIIATPFLSRGIGVVEQEIQRHYIAPIVHDVQTRQIATLEADETVLEKLSQAITPNVDLANSPLKRMSMYRKENHYFESESERIIKQERAGKLTATQNMITGTFTGSTHLTGGILYTSAGKIANGQTLRDSRVSNYNLGTAAIVSIPGNAVAILDTLRIQVQAEINRHKASRAGKLPAQLFAANLAQLDRLEQQLKTQQ